jgi:hypothetical protein
LEKIPPASKPVMIAKIRIKKSSVYIHIREYTCMKFTLKKVKTSNPIEKINILQNGI